MDRNTYLPAVRRVASHCGFLLVVALGFFIGSVAQLGKPAPKAVKIASLASKTPSTVDRNVDRPGLLPDDLIATVMSTGFEAARAIHVGLEAMSQGRLLFDPPQLPSIEPERIEASPAPIELAPALSSEPWPQAEPIAVESEAPRDPWPRIEAVPSEAWPRAQALEQGKSPVGAEDGEVKADAEDSAEEATPEEAENLEATGPALIDPQVSTPASAPPEAIAQTGNAVKVQAGRLVREGFTLAKRGMNYSARSNFIQVLRIISQALDARAATNDHSQALAAGLRALEEVDDFMPRGTRLEADLDLDSLISAHRTPALKEVDGERVTPLSAQQSYYTFAQEQLALAAGHEPAGSMALYGLAKIERALAQQDAYQRRTAGPKAMSMHQAALLVHKQNYLAANELGVLLAEYGQYERARRELALSVRLAPQPANWRNLAAVHHMLGQDSLAARARQQADLLARRALSGDETVARQHSGVLWLPPESFARTGVASDVGESRPTLEISNPVVSTPVKRRPSKAPRSKTNLFGRLPWTRASR